MAATCPLLTPAERERGAILSDIETRLMERVLAALQEADATASAALRASGAEETHALLEFFTASVHQKLYCRLCGADPDTFAGGDPKTAIAIIRNSEQIARAYWGADIEPYPRP